VTFQRERSGTRTFDLNTDGVAQYGLYPDWIQDLRQVGKVVGMPTTFLLDPQGCELASLSGPAEWASEDALRLVRAALGREPGAQM